MGGGLFADMFKDVTYRIREYIHGHEEEFLGIVESPEFTAHFRIMGTSLKNVPKGYPSDCPAAEYLKYKSWFVEYHLKDGVFDDLERFVKIAGEMYLLIKPFNDFLNRALDGFVMPDRPI